MANWEKNKTARKVKFNAIKIGIIKIKMVKIIMANWEKIKQQEKLCLAQ